MRFLFLHWGTFTTYFLWRNKKNLTWIRPLIWSYDQEFMFPNTVDSGYLDFAYLE